MKQEQIFFGLLLIALSLLGQYLHLLGEADKLSKINRAKGLPFLFRKDLIEKDFFAIQMACLLNIVLIAIYIYFTRNMPHDPMEDGFNTQEGMAMLLSLTFGYTGSSAGLKLLTKANSIYSREIDNFDYSITNKSTKMPEELDYYFPIPDGSTGIVFNGKPIPFDQFCTLQPARMASLDSGDAIRLQTIEPEQLEFVLSTGNEFVGHVPKPRKPW